MANTAVFYKGINKSMKKISIIGDKHAGYFGRHVKVEQLTNSYLGEVHYSRIIKPDYVSIWKLYDEIKFYGGHIVASYHEQVEKLMNEYQPDYVIFALGQTDLDFEYYYRSIIEDEQMDSFVDDTIDRYRHFIEQTQKEYNIGVIIKGVNPSVLLNTASSLSFTSRTLVEQYSLDDKELNLELNRKIAQGLSTSKYKFAQRFELRKQFNQKLRELADELDGLYFDLWNELIDEDTGNIYLKYMPAIETNVIVDTNEIRQLHYDKLREVNQLLEKYS